MSNKEKQNLIWHEPEAIDNPPRKSSLKKWIIGIFIILLIIGLIILIVLLAKGKGPGPGPGPDPDPPKPEPFDNISRKVPLSVKTTHFSIFESWFFMNANMS